VDVAIQRWEKMTGRQAVHADTGLTFAQMRAEPASLAGEGQGASLSVSDARARQAAPNPLPEGNF